MFKLGVILLVTLGMSAADDPEPEPKFVMCGKPAFKCFKPAVCIDETNECICPPEATGDGRLECIPADSHHTGGVVGDPKMSTFDNQTSHISFPCRYLLTNVQTEHYSGTSGGICAYKIYALNYYIDDGYYIMGIDLELHIYDGPKEDGNVGSVAIRVQGFEKDGGFEYIEYGKVGPFAKLHRWGERATMDFAGIHVETREDEKHIMHINIPECGLILGFRAYVRGSHEWPGMVIGVEDRPGVVFMDAQNTLMSSPFNFGISRLREIKHTYKLTLEQATLFLALQQDVPQDFGIGAIPCTVAGKQFLHICQNDARKAFALKMCGFLYTQVGISTCLLSDEFGESVGSIFSLCVQAMCFEFGPVCQDVKETLDCYDCVDVPPNFANLDCYGIHHAYDALYGN